LQKEIPDNNSGILTAIFYLRLYSSTIPWYSCNDIDVFKDDTGMTSMKKILSLFILTLRSLALFSQGEIVEEAKILYRNEKTGSFYLSSNGMGLDYRYGKRVNARNQILYQADFMVVKHPKETRINNYYNNNQTYVFGKINSFFELKGYIGKQHEIYRKNDRGGISIRYNYNIGPVIGILKPIYYEFLYTTGTGINNTYYTRFEQFDASRFQDILGKASFFKGINELAFVPGGTAKIGLSFEYSKDDIKVNALDVGVSLDLYPKAIPIMASNNKNFYFLNLMVGYRIGKVIDISEAAKVKTLKEKMAERKLSRSILKTQKNESQELENF
jgi:hypothetical protein